MISIEYSAGDQVSHKGQRWTVHSVYGGMVKIVNEGGTKTVRLNQVCPIG